MYVFGGKPNIPACTAVITLPVDGLMVSMVLAPATNSLLMNRPVFTKVLVSLPVSDDEYKPGHTSELVAFWCSVFNNKRHDVKQIERDE